MKEAKKGKAFPIHKKLDTHMLTVMVYEIHNYGYSNSKNPTRMI
jgi:hypothetical protein